MAIPEADIRVKFVTRARKESGFAWGRQCPGKLEQWGRCRFITDPFCRDYDWLVVVDDIPRVLPRQVEELACPRANTILITSEPSSVTCYGERFAAQFGWVITSQEDWALPHPKAIRSQTGNLWYYGKSYDDITQAPIMPKIKTISTVCSSKKQAHTMHARRFEFTQRLKLHLPDLEIYGHGVRWVDKKADILDPFKFHLTIENHIAPHLWTEKLADAFLGLTVPIYCGCTNVFDYFPKDSVVPIDITDFDGSLKTIQSLLTAEGEYERRLDSVKEARRLVLEEFNLPAMLNRIISEAEPSKNVTAGTIFNRRAMRLHHPEELWNFISWRTKNLLQTLKPSRH